MKEVQAVNNKKRTLMTKMKGFSEETETLETEKRGLLKQMVKGFNSVEAVKKGVKDLEYQQKTTSFSSVNQEN